jgi:hypothetical protein
MILDPGCRLCFATLEYQIRTAFVEEDEAFQTKKGSPYRTRLLNGSSNILVEYMNKIA